MIVDDWVNRKLRLATREFFGLTVSSTNDEPQKKKKN